MDINMGAKALRLISRIMDNSSATEYIIPHTPQKIMFSENKSPAPLPRSTPEKQGLASDYVTEYLKAISADDTVYPQSLIIVKNGKIISETGFFPYRSDVWHISYSLCKSVTGLAIGLLVDDGRLSLDDRLSDIFDKTPPLSNPLAKRLTVRQLLTMSTGIGFNEAGTVTEQDWVRSFFESSVFFEPGTRFSYNSMNSYMLSAIVSRVAGMPISQFLTERLFAPMGIVNFYWEKCPKGIEKGGMGMYLLPEDMAKLGLLYLQKGRWNGKALISEAWITEATKAQISVPDHVGKYDYGFQIWRRKGHGYYAFNGMFGQNVLVFPDRELLIAISAGDNENFQTGSFFPISERFFGDGAKLPGPTADLLAVKRLRSFERRCARMPQPRHSRWLRRFDREDRKAALSELAGKRFIMDEAEGVSVGLLPLMAQAIGNNYTRGIKAVAFEAGADGELILTLEELDECHRFPVGFEKAAYSTVTIHDEPYLIGASGLFAVNEDDVLVLKADIDFLELPNRRTIKFYMNKDGSIETKWSENPNQRYLFNGVKAVMDAAPDIDALETLSKHISKNYTERFIEKAFVRTVSGVPSH